jgi:hypothetical protein
MQLVFRTLLGSERSELCIECGGERNELCVDCGEVCVHCVDWSCVGAIQSCLKIGIPCNHTRPTTRRLSVSLREPLGTTEQARTCSDNHSAAWTAACGTATCGILIVHPHPLRRCGGMAIASGFNSYAKQCSTLTLHRNTRTAHSRHPRST